ncbi:MAG: hypothetical protein NTY08_17315 [Proteobacteria bacterium]|nr:hypothetical protein [Pseudomonadota bacterium]
MDPRRKIFDEISDDLHTFFKRVGKVWVYDELKFLDLEPEMMTGEFRCYSVQSLIDFCASNPEYHIISRKDCKVYNKFMPEARAYYLADGDAEPELFVDFMRGLDVHELLQVGYTVFTPIVGTIKGGNDA